MFQHSCVYNNALQRNEHEPGRTNQPQQQFGGSQGELAAVGRYYRPVRR